MSDLDPFGTSDAARHYRKGANGSHIPKLTEVVDIVGGCMSSSSAQRARAWNRLTTLMGVLNALLGACILFWALATMRGQHAFVHALVLGGALLALGVIGVVTAAKQVPSVKTMFMVGAGVVLLVSWSFMNKVTVDTETDCLLAETFVRIDHLEEAMQSLRHDDMINGLMIRLDHMHQELAEAEKGAADMAAHERQLSKFKDQDQQFVWDKMNSLLAMADDSLTHTSAEIESAIKKIADLQDAADAEANAAEKSKLNKELRGLRGRKDYLNRKRETLNSLIAKVESKGTQGLTPEEYDEVLVALEKANSNEDLATAIAEEKEQVGFVKQSMIRLINDEYHTYSIGNWHERHNNRTKAREESRKKFEVYMDSVSKAHVNKFSSGEAYMRSLNERMEDLPDHCMQGIGELWPVHLLGWLSILSSGVALYVGLTSVVVDVKKDH